MNKLFVTGYLLLSILFMGSCKKNDAPTTTTVDASLQQKVIQWLNKQQTNNQPQRVALNKSIQENLQWRSAWEAQQERDDKMLIIPIGKGVTFKNNSKRNVDNYLAIYFEKTGEVYRGRVIQSVAGSLFTKKTIPAIYGNTKEDLNGTYIVLNVHDIFYAELTYEHNKLKEENMQQTKPESNARTASNCVDWYRVTTYYNTENGQILYQTETYLGTTCSGCVPYTGTPQTTLTGETEWDCNTAGGGGEGDEEGVFARKEPTWKAYDGNVSGLWATVWATDILKGRYNANEPQGGHFKSITFGGTDQCQTCPPGVSWEFGANYKSLSEQFASSRVTGRITRLNNPGVDSDKTKEYRFDQVF